MNIHDNALANGKKGIKDMNYGEIPTDIIMWNTTNWQR